MEVRGNAASLARRRFRIDHVPANLASKGQVKGVAESLKWSCDIINVAYDNRGQSHYTAKADAPPQSTRWRVGTSAQPCAVTALTDKPKAQ
eukprot:8356967-Pyramimonas_sp.AAC.1